VHHYREEVKCRPRDIGGSCLSSRPWNALCARQGAWPPQRREGRTSAGKDWFAIRTHDISASLEDRKTLESKILFDADKVDAFGVIGILRYIRVVYGKLPVDFIIEDIEMRWEGLSFPETREAVIEEYKYVKDYFIQLKNELEVGTYDGELDSVLTSNHDNLPQ
jgi:hypothetical protein